MIKNTLKLSSQIIYRVLHDKISLSALLKKEQFSGLSPQDQAKTKQLCFGTLRWYHQLDWIAKQLLHKKLKPKDQDIYSILLLGLYQLTHMRTADYAIVSESVNLAKASKRPWASGLINKLLRRFITEKESLLSACDKNAVSRYSHPDWLIETLQNSWSNEWEAILQANNQQAPLFLRVNRRKITAKDYLLVLQQHDISAKLVVDYPDAIQLDTALPVNKIPGFYDGLCSVQDLAGQRVIDYLDIHPGMRVLDACAAPGSKLCHLLEAVDNLDVTAIDQDPKRLPKITQNIDRLELSHEQLDLVLADVLDISSWWNGQLFDRIVVDAPCSATGVIRRHPDIKVLRQAEDIAQYPEIQLHIVNSLWPLLAPGGKLIYTTCSVLPEENSKIIERLTEQHADLALDSTSATPCYQQLPKINGPDGFFYAALVKNSHS